MLDPQLNRVVCENAQRHLQVICQPIIWAKLNRLQEIFKSVAWYLLIKKFKARINTQKPRDIPWWAAEVPLLMLLRGTIARKGGKRKGNPRKVNYSVKKETRQEIAYWDSIRHCFDARRLFLKSQENPSSIVIHNSLCWTTACLVICRQSYQRLLLIFRYSIYMRRAREFPLYRL